MNISDYLRRSHLTARVLAEVLKYDIRHIRVIWAPGQWNAYQASGTFQAAKVIDVSHLSLQPTFEDIVSAVLDAPCWPSALDC